MLTSSHPKIFSNGLDLDYVVEGGFEAGLQSMRNLCFLCEEMLSYPMPIVAAIDGHAFAGGAMMSLA